MIDINQINDGLKAIARGDMDSLEAFFHSILIKIPVEGTSTTCFLHCITLDGNGRPRVADLAKHLQWRIVDYAIPRDKIKAAEEHLLKTGSTEKYLALGQEARGLFTSLAKTGEGGELILFLLAERILKLPQLMCKMHHKTNPQLHFNGADGLHAGVDLVSEKLCLYWGESKMHSRPASAITECIKSIAVYLKSNGGVGASVERDLQLLGSYLNIDNPPLEQALKNYLDPNSKNFNMVEYKGICFAGFDYDKYPTKANEVGLEGLAGEIKSEASKWLEQLKVQLSNESIDSFEMHVFLMPFPSVDDFRREFLSNLGVS